jgi:hypothetical protein
MRADTSSPDKLAGGHKGPMNGDTPGNKGPTIGLEGAGGGGGREFGEDWEVVGGGG